MRKLVSSSLILLICSVSLLSLAQKSRASGVTALRFDPATLVLGPDYCIGDTFTLVARIDNIDDLYGFGVKIKWNTTFLEYEEHLAKIPVETYPDGILHEQVAIVRNEANATKGIYELAATSLSPAHAFIGSGIAFEITFRVKYQPMKPEPNATFSVVFIKDDFAHSGVGDLCAIPHYTVNCEITIIPYQHHSADVNYDNRIDIGDLILCANAYGSTPLDPRWNLECDVARVYGYIDILDLVTIASFYGEEL